MSRPLSLVGRMDELLVEARSQVREHRQSDAWELAAFDVAERLVETGDLAGLRRLIGMMRERDVAENARHEEMARLSAECRVKSSPSKGSGPPCGCRAQHVPSRRRTAWSWLCR